MYCSLRDGWLSFGFSFLKLKPNALKLSALFSTFSRGKLSLCSSFGIGLDAENLSSSLWIILSNRVCYGAFSSIGF